LRNFLESRPVGARRIGMAGRLARWGKRRPAVAALTAAVAALGLALTVSASLAAVWLGDSRRQALDHLEKAILEKNKANQSERLAMQTLFEARLAEARAIRHSGLPGRRIDSLTSIKHAAGLLEPLGLGGEERRELRNDVIASWSLVDLDWTQDEVRMPRGEGVGWDRDIEHHLVHDNAAQAIVVRNFAAKQIVAKLPLPANYKPDLRTVVYSPDGQYIAVKLSAARPPDKVQVWKRDGSTVLPPTDVSTGPALPFDFSPDGKWLALACPGRRIRVLAMPKLSTAHEWTDWSYAVMLRYSPDSTRLAVRRGDQIEIRDAASGKVVRPIAFSPFVFRLAWSPDGQFLAAASHDRKVYVWRTDTGALHTMLAGHAAPVVDVHFHPKGRLLASTAWDGTTRLWDYRSGEQLIRAEHACAHFSRDGRWLGGDCGRWEVLTDAPAVAVHQPRAPNSSMSRSDFFDIHPDGRLMVASNRNQWVLWDTATGRALAVRDGTWARFDAAGAYLLTGADTDSLVRVPIERRQSKQEIVYTLGKPQPLGKLKLGPLELDHQSGNLLTAPEGSGVVLLTDTSTGKITGRLNHRRARWVDVTADGRLAATGSWHSVQVLVHNLKTMQVVHRLPAGSARVRFRPDGAMLAVGQIKDYSFWAADSGKLVRRLDRSAGASVPGPVAFSPDGNTICICPDNHLLCLIDAQTFAELARLPLAEDQFVSALTFTPDGRRLLAGTEAGALHLFDLGLLRSRLAKLGLDWPGSPNAAAAATAPANVRVEFSSSGS
jgi:WD40 repeat protein